MKHELPELPFSENALEPHISAETLRFHHGKHHRAYVNEVNQLIRGTQFETAQLEEIVMTASDGPLFNQAAQAWNHSFLWQSLSPEGKQPQGQFLAAIHKDFGSLEKFQQEFSKAAINQFGSGWVWLVRNHSDGKLLIEATSNAKNPLRAGLTPLLVCDVWEHAYYIDYRNERAKYLKALSSVLNWDFAASNFESIVTLAA